MVRSHTTNGIRNEFQKTLILKLRKVNNIESKEFNEIVQLGDDNSKTLGFLPKVAFEKYSQQNQLIGAFDKDTSDLLGYILYRTSYNKATIVHLCIDDAHRNKGVAKKLVDYLKKDTKKFSGIRLSCRNDYGINEVWEGFGFVPMFEKPGRSKKGLPLTIWWFPQHQQHDLFSQITEYELKNKISVVIDMNIFLDLKNKRNEESLALQSDWLSPEINLYLTREIYNEINRSKDSQITKTGRAFARNFNELPFTSKDKYSSIFDQLSEMLSIKSLNDKSDLKHIAYAISEGVEYFVTRDQGILDNKDKFNEFGLKVNRPSEFITLLDEDAHSSKYKPQRLVGTNINSSKVTVENTEKLFSIFLTDHEKKNDLKDKIRKCLSYPKNYELLTVTKESENLAFIIFDRSNPNKLEIPIFRLLQNKLSKTLAKHLLFKIIFTATSEARLTIEITEEYISKEIEEIISETSFVKAENTWVKINIKEILTKEETINRVNTIKPNKIVDAINLNSTNPEIEEQYENSNFYKIERHLFPLKIVDLEIPSYIIPIKPHWAEALFDDKSNEKINLFEPNYPLLLNRENVYYRSKSGKITSPARILWYVSEDKQSKVKGHIRACSYIDAVYVDSSKKLFKRFKELGIYKWEQIQKTVDKNNDIMAFVFSDTELFNENISVNYLKNNFQEKENKKFMILSPIEIKKETFIDFYRKGMKI